MAGLSAQAGEQGRLGADFHRLWSAYTISAFGSALSNGALPLIAVTLLHVSTWQVSELAVLAGLASAVIALPFGGFIEYRRKRPVMIGSDLVRCAATLSIPAAAAAGFLSYTQLCAVAVINTAAAIMFVGASGAHLKSLVPGEQLGAANSRLEATFWLSNSAGSSAGGLLISLLGATVTLGLDAVSYLASAVGVARIQSPEPPPPSRLAQGRGAGDLAAGWTYILRHPDLRALFWNAMLFGGTVIAVAPLTAVLMLRSLGFSPLQYGLVLGLPCVGGLCGAACTPRLTARYGLRPVLLGSGLLRAVWMLPLPFVPAGPGGLVILIAADSGLLFCAGTFNPAFATYRMRAVTDEYMGRVGTAWSISSRSTQPAFIAGAGVLAATAGVRPTLGAAAVLCLLSAALLPWRTASIQS